MDKMVDSESSEDPKAQVKQYKPSYVLIAIDTHPTMFVKNEEGTSPFQDCLTACYEVANSLLFTRNKRNWCPFGIILAHEDGTTLVEFSQSIIDSIKFLQIEKDRTYDELCAKYQRKGAFDLGAFFLKCKRKFKEITSLSHKRTTIYITNDANPTINDSQKRFTALNEVKNFVLSDIMFELVTMTHDFDYSIFYNELFSISQTQRADQVIEDSDGLVEKLSSAIVTRVYQRFVNFFPFMGDKTRFVKVVLKNPFSTETLYNNQYVSQDEKPVIKVNPKTPVSDYLLKGTTLKFDPQEYHDIRNNDLSMGYSLVYVSDRVVELGVTLYKPSLIELNNKEDGRIFANLWQYCVDKNKVLICARKLKFADKIKFVEFIPKLIDDSMVFMTKTMPTVENIKLPMVKSVSGKSSYSEKKVDAVNQLIDDLSVDYFPEMFPNVQLSVKKAYLKAKLLGEKEEPFVDVTADNDVVDRQISTVASKFRSVFSLLDEQTGTKRKAATTKSNATKKAK